MKKSVLVLNLLLAVFLLSFVACKKDSKNEPGESPTSGEVTPPALSISRVQMQSMGTMIVYMLYDDPNDRVFVYPLLLSDGTTDAVSGKTYVYPGEMSQTYAYWMLSDYTTHALYTQATFCKTDLGNDKIRIDATATDTNNDAFTLTYDEGL